MVAGDSQVPQFLWPYLLPFLIISAAKKKSHISVWPPEEKKNCHHVFSLTKYPGIQVSRHSHLQNQQSPKKNKKKEENHLLNFQSSLRSFLFRTSRDGFAHDSTIGHSCGSVKALPSRSNTWMLFMDRYRLMLYGLCAGKKKGTKGMSAVYVCVNIIYIYMSCVYVGRKEQVMAIYINIMYVTIFVYDARTMFITHMYLS